MPHVIILGAMNVYTRALAVASAGEQIVHFQCTGYQDWESELAVLDQKITEGDISEIEIQVETLEGMLPS